MTKKIEPYKGMNTNVVAVLNDLIQWANTAKIDSKEKFHLLELCQMFVDFDKFSVMIRDEENSE